MSLLVIITKIRNTTLNNNFVAILTRTSKIPSKAKNLLRIKIIQRRLATITNYELKITNLKT